MQRVAVEGLLFGQFDQPAEVHHGHPVGDVLHKAQVVRDEDVGQLEFRLQFFQQVDHLGLDRDVQGRDRLVGQQQPGVQRQGPGDDDALALAAGELVGIAPGVLGQKPDDLEQPGHPLLPFVGCADAVDVERLADEVSDPAPGVQGGVRILVDDLGLTPELPQARTLEAGQVLPVEEHPARRGLLQAQQHPAQGGLAAAALPHEAEDLAGRHAEGDILHRQHEPLAARKTRALQGIMLDHVLGG